jgi:hypothetical protein
MEVVNNSLYCDRRIANVQKWWLSPPKDVFMRVPDEIKKCVVFLGHLTMLRDNFASLEPRGTGFIIAQPSEFGDGDKASFLYLVTAKHVIDGLAGELSGARINRRDGTAEMVHLGNKWWFHPSDPDVDVAVIPFGGTNEDITIFDFQAFPTRAFATDKAIEEAAIGVGDEVFITGLFAHNLGSSQNMPIVRMGNIALMSAGEPIQSGDRKMEAHLIESRSIGGLSGSPAFVRQTISVGFAHPTNFEEHQLYRKMKPEEVKEMRDDGLFITGVGPFYLLGLMHGHWDIPVGQKNNVLVAEDQRGRVNMGIALVVPATKVLEVINQPELSDMRRGVHEEMEKQIRRGGKVTLDSVQPKEQLTAKGLKIPILERGAFFRDLTKATRKRDKK